MDSINSQDWNAIDPFIVITIGVRGAMYNHRVTNYNTYKPPPLPLQHVTLCLLFNITSRAKDNRHYTLPRIKGTLKHMRGLTESKSHCSKYEYSFLFALPLSLTIII